MCVFYFFLFQLASLDDFLIKTFSKIKFIFYYDIKSSYNITAHRIFMIFMLISKKTVNEKFITWMEKPLLKNQRNFISK